MSAARLIDRLREGSVEFELIAHRHTETAAAEANALGMRSSEVAKTVVVRTPGGYVRALVPVDERLDLHKLRHALDAGTASLASEEELERDFPEFELGAVPPIGGRADPVLIDPRLADREWIVFEAGTHCESVRLHAADFLNLAKGRVLDLCVD